MWGIVLVYRQLRESGLKVEGYYFFRQCQKSNSRLLRQRQRLRWKMVLRRFQKMIWMVLLAVEETSDCRRLEPFQAIPIYEFLILSHNPIPPKAPATTGAFYFFNQAQSIKNLLQYLALSPPSTADIEPLCLPQYSSYISTHSKARRLYSPFLLIQLFPQRNYQILRSLSPSRMPLARLNLTAI